MLRPGSNRGNVGGANHAILKKPTKVVTYCMQTGEILQIDAYSRDAVYFCSAQTRGSWEFMAKFIARKASERNEPCHFKGMPRIHQNFVNNSPNVDHFGLNVGE